jgi:hypothetical protein
MLSLHIGSVFVFMLYLSELLANAAQAHQIKEDK